jgi:hypothetical protein
MAGHTSHGHRADLGKYLTRGLKGKVHLSNHLGQLHTGITHGKGCAVLFEVFCLLGGQAFFAKWVKGHLADDFTKPINTQKFIDSLED